MGRELDGLERLLLGSDPALTRGEVAERTGVAQDVAEELWQRLGFPRAADDDVAFTDADVEALRLARELTEIGVLDPDSRAALVRTWGRSFARLAEWQTALLTTAAGSSADPAARFGELTEEVLPRVERLQSYIWRRHLASATARQLAGGEAGELDRRTLAVGFVDIVGYTSTSRNLEEAELVSWVEGFEDTTTSVVNDHGGRVIKNIGDEVLFVADDPAAACEIGLLLAERGVDEDDGYPAVRAGLAHGEVVARLGDVFGETVNLAARITSASRPGAVLVDEGVHGELCGEHGARHADRERTADPDEAPYDFRRVRRASVKNYSGLRVWALRRPRH